MRGKVPGVLGLQGHPWAAVAIVLLVKLYTRIRYKIYLNLVKLIDEQRNIVI